MIRRQVLLAPFLLPALPARAQRADYALDQDSGQIGFTFRYLMLFTAMGRFERFRATLRLDPAHPMTMGVDCVLDMTAVTVSLQGATERLRSEAFFDVAHFPQARFHGEANGQGDAASFPITGELTLRDVTRPFRMQARLIERRPGAVRFEAEGEISRAAFGLLADRPIVSDTIQLTVDVWIALQDFPVGRAAPPGTP
ncbi:MAG: YceI family protein [Rubritepida sp.]|nr:YceI family protein [Rubritepida sp.]